MNENETKDDETGSDQSLEGESEADPCPPGFIWDAKLQACVPIIPDEPS